MEKKEKDFKATSDEMKLRFSELSRQLAASQRAQAGL